MELNTLQILSILKSDIFAKEVFKGVYARDQLPLKIDYPSGIIINTDIASLPGSHWLAIYFNEDKSVDFFDSMGQSPEFYNLNDYLKSFSTKINYNCTKLQSNYSTFCGYYCCLFILYKSRNFSMESFIKKFSDLTHFNDLVIFNILSSRLKWI